MRTHALPVLALLWISAPLASQTTFTAPQGYLTKPGNGSACNEAINLVNPASKNVRYQCTEADMPRRKAVLTRMEWRTAARPYTSSNGTGRSFSSVTLKIGHAIRSLTTTFSSNWATTATTVYNAKLTLPDHANTTPTQVWGNAGSFPFSTTFAWDPKHGELLQDWSHNGGKTVTGQRWGTYELDGKRTVFNLDPTIVTPSATSTTSPNRYLPGPPYHTAGAACRDTNAADRWHHATARLSLQVHPWFRYSTTSGAAQIRGSTTNTAPKGRLIGMLSIGGNDKGVVVNTRCNRLHIAPGTSLGVQTTVADTLGSAENWFPAAPMFGWNDNWAGQAIYWQAAWEDSKTGILSLTLATRLVLPTARTVPTPPEYAQAVFGFTQAGGGTFRKKLIGSMFNPIDRFTAK